MPFSFLPGIFQGEWKRVYTGTTGAKEGYTFLIDLEGAQDGGVQVASACYGKGHIAVEAGGAGYQGYHFAAGIAEVAMHCAPASKLPSASLHPGYYALT